MVNWFAIACEVNQALYKVCMNSKTLELVILSQVGKNKGTLLVLTALQNLAFSSKRYY